MKKEKKKSKKFSGVRGKILKRVLILMQALLIVTGIITSYLNYHSTNTTLENAMIETVEVAAERVEWEIQAYKNIAADLGTVARMSNESLSDEDKQEIIDEKLKEYSLSNGKLISDDGIAHIDGTDYSDREYFKASMEGEVYVTEPIIAKTTGKLSIIISAPVWEGGISGSKVVGVVFIIPDEEFLNDIVKSIQVSDGGSSYILDANGNTIAHKDMELVKNSSNTINDAKSDSSLEDLASIESAMINGEHEFDTYRYEGVKKFMAYMPIEGSNGWSIAVNAPVNDFMTGTYLAIGITVVIIIIAAIISLVVARRLADSISNPIKTLSERLNTFAAGDLSSEFPKVNTGDEISDMAIVASDMAGKLGRIINDVKYRLGEMAGGNFALSSEMSDEYVGELSDIDVAIDKLNLNMNETLEQIIEASSQVSSGSGNLAEAAQSLAEGATEQAGAVEELLATITNITESIGHTSDKVEEAHKMTQQYADKADASREDVKGMVHIMESITETSRNIESIIGDIEEIASQTNLLSLNASIEAARAGEAGKGFAVVADQIGKLADESAQSAVRTRELIMDALNEVERGSAAAEQTADAINEVVNGIKSMAEAATDVSQLTREAADSMVQAELGVNQISEVVQANSATAQETSATSEELSAQAISLDDLVSNFKLKEH